MTLVRKSCLLAVSLFTVATASAVASGKQLNQDQVRDALKSGEIRSLDDVTAIATKAVPGQIIKVEIERSHGILVYEFKIIGTNGRIREIKINAKTLDVLEIE